MDSTPRSISPLTLNSSFLNHVGVSVSDIEASVKWYTEVLHFKLLHPIICVNRQDKPNSTVFSLFSDERIRSIKIAFLSMYGCNDAGFEMFELIQDDQENTTFKDTAFSSTLRPGIFYTCLTDSDVKSVTERVLNAGGSILGDMFRPGPIDEKVQAQYLRDPWGNVIEVINVPFQTFQRAVNGFC